MVKTYECPGCGADMKFDSEKQKMLCEHCGTSCTVEEIENIQLHDVEREDEVNGVFGEPEQNGEFKVYKCPSCGAELLTDEHTSATFCSFCGQPSLVEDRLNGVSMPSRVIPFKINREKAKEKYLGWAKKGRLTPSEFYSNSTIEKISGIYVPFWLYDYNARMELSAQATKVRHKTKGNYRYTYTDHYMITRDVEADYDKVPADASEKMPDEVMDKLEPFRYEDMKEFEMPYLSGYYSEKYNYTADEMSGRIEKRIREYILDFAKSTIKGYNTVNIRHSNSRLNKQNAEYVLMPVWVLNCRYNEKDYLFTLNGQTGKIVAERPVSKKKMLFWFLLITAIVFAVLFLIGNIFI